MSSPFPGMDPRLESPLFWRSFQIGFLYAVHAQLNSILPNHYAASLDRHVWGWIPESEVDPFLVVDRGCAPLQSVAPFTTKLSFITSSAEPFVRIHDLRCPRDITVVEVVGPQRKEAGHPRNHYLWKRKDYFGSGVSLVEMDLLRLGQRIANGNPPLPTADYSIMVSDKSAFPDISLWNFTVRDPIPLVSIPLDYFEQSVHLDVKACIDRALDEGRFERSGIENRLIDPPLREPDATWAKELLASRQI